MEKENLKREHAKQRQETKTKMVKRDKFLKFQQLLWLQK